MHIVFDWDGTIVSKKVSNEAALRICRTIGLKVTRSWMYTAQKTFAHYPVTKKAIQAYTGISDNIMQTKFMTMLFAFHYMAVTNELREKSVHKNFFHVLRRIKKKFPGIKFSIATALTQDIIENSLKVLRVRKLFHKVYADTPDLRFSKKQLLEKALTECKEVHIMVGDRSEDIQAGKHVGAKTIATSWGQHDHKILGADYVIHKPDELIKIVEELGKPLKKVCRN
ncbi:MAG: HAD hydrolase-like protein [Candidatus Diapherotrites archaeon]|nr:HAD hydrolase-like protein [Candidatus Diapherotrites archaeon]